MEKSSQAVQFYHPKTVAEMFSVSLTSVYRWIHQGAVESITLPGGTQYRISAAAVERIKRGEFSSRKPSVDLERIKELEYRDKIALAQLHEMERSSK